MRVGWCRRDGLDEVGVLLSKLAAFVGQFVGLLLLQLLLMLLLLLLLSVSSHVSEARRAVLEQHLFQLLVSLLGLLDLGSEYLILTFACLLLWPPGLLLQIGLALTASQAFGRLLTLFKASRLFGTDVGRGEGLLREGLLLLLGGLGGLLLGGAAGDICPLLDGPVKQLKVLHTREKGLHLLLFVAGGVVLDEVTAGFALK